MYIYADLNLFNSSKINFQKYCILLSIRSNISIEMLRILNTKLYFVGFRYFGDCCKNLNLKSVEIFFYEL